MTKEQSTRRTNKTEPYSTNKEGSSLFGWLVRTVKSFANRNSQQTEESSSNDSYVDEDTVRRQQELSAAPTFQQITQPIQFEVTYYICESPLTHPRFKPSTHTEYRPRFSSSLEEDRANGNNNVNNSTDLEARLANIERLISQSTPGMVHAPIPQRTQQQVPTTVDILKSTVLSRDSKQRNHENGHTSTPYQNSAFSLFNTPTFDRERDMQDDYESPVHQPQQHIVNKSRTSFATPATPAAFSTPQTRKSSQRKSTPHPNAEKRKSTTSIATPTAKKAPFTPSSQSSFINTSSSQMDLDASYNYSETAKRILETLEHLGSPIVDVRRRRAAQLNLASKIQHTQTIISSNQKQKEQQQEDNKRKRREEALNYDEEMPPKESVSVSVTPLKKRKTGITTQVPIMPSTQFTEEEEEESTFSSQPVVQSHQKSAVSGKQKKKPVNRTPYARKEANGPDENYEEEKQEMKDREKELSSAKPIVPSSFSISFDQPSDFEFKPIVPKPVVSEKKKDIPQPVNFGQFQFESSVKKPVIPESTPAMEETEEDDGFSPPAALDEEEAKQFTSSLDIFAPVSGSFTEIKKPEENIFSVPKTDSFSNFHFITEQKKITQPEKTVVAEEKKKTEEKPVVEAKKDETASAFSAFSNGFASNSSSSGFSWDSSEKKEDNVAPISFSFEQKKEDEDQPKTTGFSFGPTSTSDSAFAASIPSSSLGFSFVSESTDVDKTKSGQSSFSFAAPVVSESTTTSNEGFKLNSFATTKDEPKSGFSFDSTATSSTFTAPSLDKKADEKDNQSGGFSFGDTASFSSDTTFAFNDANKKDDKPAFSTSGGFNFAMDNNKQDKKEEKSDSGFGGFSFDSAPKQDKKEESSSMGFAFNDSSSTSNLFAPVRESQSDKSNKPVETSIGGGISFDQAKTTTETLSSSGFAGVSGFDFAGAFGSNKATTTEKPEDKKPEESSTTSSTLGFSFNGFDNTKKVDDNKSSFGGFPFGSQVEPAKEDKPASPTFNFSGSGATATAVTTSPTTVPTSMFNFSGTSDPSKSNSLFTFTGSNGQSSTPSLPTFTTSASPPFGVSGNLGSTTPTPGSFSFSAPNPSFGSGSPVLGFSANVSSPIATNGNPFSQSSQPSQPSTFSSNPFAMSSQQPATFGGGVGGMEDDDSLGSGGGFSSGFGPGQTQQQAFQQPASGGFSFNSQPAPGFNTPTPSSANTFAANPFTPTAGTFAANPFSSNVNIPSTQQATQEFFIDQSQAQQRRIIKPRKKNKKN
jgi:hypothetical protein